MPRPKGSPNRIATDLRQSILDAYDQIGATSWLVDLAKLDPKAFLLLLGKCVPQQTKAEISGIDGGPIQQTITIELVRPGTIEQEKK